MSAKIATEVGRSASISFPQSLTKEVWVCDVSQIQAEGLTVERSVIPSASGNFGAAAEVKFEITATEPVTADLEFDLVDATNGSIIDTIPLTFEAR